MLASPLAGVWSTDTIPGGNAAAARVPNPKDTENFNSWFLHNLLFCRWSIHTLGAALSTLPPNETRLQNKALEPFYEHVRSLIGTMHKTAENRGITVPPTTSVPVDWKDEAAIPTESIRRELKPHLSVPVARVVDFWVELDRAREQYHWTTFLALIAVGVPIYMDGVIKAGNKVGIGADETLVPYFDKLEDEKLSRYIEVMGEEVMRIRADAGETGWREDEAKRTVETNRKVWEEFWSLN